MCTMPWMARSASIRQKKGRGEASSGVSWAIGSAGTSVPSIARSDWGQRVKRTEHSAKNAIEL